MAKVIGIKFKNTAKVYYFSPEKEGEEYLENSGVIVETAKAKKDYVICSSSQNQ